MKKHPFLVLTGVSVLAAACTKVIKDRNEKKFLKYAGIDITKPDVLIDAIKFFDETVKEYQKILRKMLKI